MEDASANVQGATYPDVSHLAVSLFSKVKLIKRTHPQVSRKIDSLEREIRDRLELIKGEIAKLNRKDQDLVKILVINGIHRTAEEVLID
jgi:hypothetical protein